MTPPFEHEGDPCVCHVLRALTDKPRNLTQIMTTMRLWGPGWDVEIEQALGHLVESGRVELVPVKSTGAPRWVLADE